MFHTFFKFIFLLSSFIGLEGKGCFNEGKSWTDDFLEDVTLHISNASACLDLCKKTVGCKAFSWLGKGYEDHHFKESCLTYNGIGTLEACQDCISGQLVDCQLCSQEIAKLAIYTFAFFE